MKRALIFALITAIWAGGTCLAQTRKASEGSKAAVRQETTSFPLLAAAQQAPERGAPAPQGANPSGARGGVLGGPIKLGPDDKPAFPDPPAGSIRI